MTINKITIPTRVFGQQIPVAPDMNEVVRTVNELVDAVNAGLATTNGLVGGIKLVQYRSSRLYGVPTDALTLDRLTPESIVPDTLAYVQNPASRPLVDTLPPAAYIATVVPAGTADAVLVSAYIGAAPGDTVPITWQPWAAGAALPPQADTSQATVLFVYGYGQTLPGVRGSQLQPYASVADARADAVPGDTIVVLPGGQDRDARGRHCYGENVNVPFDVSLVALGLVLISGEWIYPQFPGIEGPQQFRTNGFTFLNQVSVVGPVSDGQEAEFKDCVFEEEGRFFYLNQGNPAAGEAFVRFIRTRWASTMATSGAAPIRFQSRNDAGAVSKIRLLLDDCELSSQHTAIFSGYASNDDYVVLRGSTRFTPGAGQPLIATTRVNSPVPLTEAELLRDERGGASSLVTRNPLALTTTFMDSVLALTYTDCDADPADSPPGSFPSQWFDALYKGKNCHFYCGRSTYDPAATPGTTGQGPAWHYFTKLG